MCFSSTILSAKQHVAYLMGINYKQILGFKLDSLTTSYKCFSSTDECEKLHQWMTETTQTCIKFFAV
jgi:hypothetical protein